MSLEIELGKLKKAKINEFKGTKLLDLRNYFQKDGEERPTQKGISLTAEQWQALLQRKDDISRALGIEVFDAGNSVTLGKRKKSKPAEQGETEDTDKAEGGANELKQDNLEEKSESE